MKSIFSLLLLFWIPPAMAYLGPGLSAGTLGVVLGIVASVFIAFFAVFWYPIKRLLKKRRASKDAKMDKSSVDDEAGTRSEASDD